MKVLVIGAGNMVRAIVSGLPREETSSWGVTSKTGESAKKLAAELGMTFVEKTEDFGDPDWILLGCKPQQIKEIRLPDVPVMSLLAAVPEKNQKDILGVKHLVRVMPNIPVKFRKGVTLITSQSTGELSYPVSLFQKLGLVKVLPEDEFVELTLLTGSGPAFFYEFTKTLASAFSSLSQDEREELARAVLQGAAAGSQEKELSSLIDAVTSKGGVTIAVLEEWRKKNFSGLIGAGVDRGMERTAEIKEHLLQS